MTEGIGRQATGPQGAPVGDVDEATPLAEEGGLAAEENGLSVEENHLPADEHAVSPEEALSPEETLSPEENGHLVVENGVRVEEDEPFPGTEDDEEDEQLYDEYDDAESASEDAYDDEEVEVEAVEGGEPAEAGEEVYEQPPQDLEDFDELDERPGRHSAGNSLARRRGRRRLAVIAGAVVAAIVVIGVVGFFKVSDDIHPAGESGHVVTVSIPNGASTAKIGDLLAKAGVIHGPLVFELYVKLEGAGPLMPGTYHLPTNEPYSRAVYALEQGPPPLVEKLVVPEGFTVRQIAARVSRLQGIGITSQAFMEAATSGQVRSPYEPASTNNLEGFLFPATYPVQTGETADDLVQYMVDTFDHYASQLGLSQRAAHLHYSPYEVLKVASIVEREAKFDSDRGPIASVIYNRLSLGMPIGAESTLLYGLGDPQGNVNIETPNPYNTLINKGLPPTPISNPGIPSLEAALSPPKTSYLFWVETNPDGKMSYASTQAGFVQLQADCRKVHLC